MKFSCVIPIGGYNVEWLEECLLSIPVGFDELILVTDEKCQFHSAIRNMLSWVHVTVHQVTVTKPGPDPAANAGVAVATGDYISLLNSDDFYDRVGVVDLMKYIRNRQTQKMIYTGQVHIFGCGEDVIWPQSPDFSKIYINNCVPGASFFPRKLWYELGGLQCVTLSDWHFWKRAAGLGYKQDHLNLVFHHYRRWQGSLTGQIGWNAGIGHEPYE